MEENLVIPEHVAIILDGNGRWAKRKGLPTAMGHRAGCEALERIVEDAANLGIKYLTIYGFSTENWSRPEDEVDSLMKLFRYYAKRLMSVAKEHGVRVRMIGERSRFAPDIVDAINRLEESTKDNTNMTFVIAVNYGGRDEITRAAKKIINDAKEGKIGADDMTEEVFASYLDTAGIPDPDLLIRTGGEMRLSNFLLWEAAYTELYVTECLWPDFTGDDLIEAVRAYDSRDRRFGGRKDPE